MIELTADYIADMMVRMAHHSTAIEGNSLTQGETKSILIDNYIPRAMDMREYNEVLNYKNLVPFLEESVHKNVLISVDFCKELHKIICKDAIESVPGKFKVTKNAVIGADWEPTPPYMVLTTLTNWCEDLNYQLDNAASNSEIIEAVCRQHIKFEHIHPFPDGNGRVGRALMVYACLLKQVSPPIVTVEKRKEYISLLNNNDEKGLSEFALKLQQEELHRIELFPDGVKTGLFVRDEK